MNRSNKLEKIRNIFYRDTSELRWFEVLSSKVNKKSNICEIGSGSGAGFQNQNYPDCAHIFGIDLDERVVSNKLLNEAAVGSAYELQKITNNKKFDVIYSQMVVEHIDDVEKFIEVQLLCLSEGGYLVHSTVSKYYWTSLLNNVVPEVIKIYLVRTLGSGRPPEDVFPAFYKFNSSKQVKAIAEKFDVSYEIIHSDQAPGYLRRSYILMLIYTLIHRPLQFVFAHLRPTFVVVMWENEQQESNSP